MDNSIAWAFSQAELNAGEKLVLVWLAWRAGAGVGLMQREQLAAVTEYEPRSLQRILKSLRDRGLLRESDGWYWLGQPPGHEAPPFPPADLQPGDALSPRPVSSYVEARISERDQDAAGERIAAAITEAADAHLVRFNDAALRLLTGIERIAIASAQLMPPDPVRESVHFKAFMTGGMLTEEEAYELARKRLEAEGAAASSTPALDQAARLLGLPPPQSRTHKAADGGTYRYAASDSRQYLDSPLGRFERIRDILDPDGAAPWADAMTVWQRLEDSENKHTVSGETDAFELLYPAIVVAARREAGKMTLAQFLDEKAIRAGRAPWDLESSGPTEDRILEAEIARMLTDLERANHPMAQVGPRTVEKDEGRTLTESVAAYYARVKRVHQQLKKLQDMGV